MNGYSSHTYLWQNAGGEKFWVKYHFKTDQGIECFDFDSARAMTAEDPDHHVRDLHGAIARGDSPSWTLHMQIMPFAEAADYRFNPFDLTKVWPHRDYPLVEVGRMVLDRNPDNYFAQIEQAAFEPANMVPGIGPSPDKMLLGRMFSYPDAHRYRIGTNYLQLPVNAPRAEVHSYNKDGSMRYRHNGDRPMYAPNSYGGPKADPQYEMPTWSASGEMVRSAYTKRRDDDDFGQAGTLYRKVLDDAAQSRLAYNITQHLKGCEPPVLGRAIEYWTNVDRGLGARVATMTGVAAAEGVAV
jgi:catalase